MNQVSVPNTTTTYPFNRGQQFEISRSKTAATIIWGEQEFNINKQYESYFFYSVIDL